MNSAPADRIKILLIDDHTLLRDSLAQFLANEPDFEVVGGCSSVEEAFALLAAQPADVVLLDLDLRGKRGTAFLEDPRRGSFPGQVLVVTAALPPLEAARLVRLGAAGFFLKDESAESLARRIRQLMRGEPPPDQHYLRAVVQLVAQPSAEEPGGRLSERERSVMRCVLEGLSNKEIAGRLHISESLVKATLQDLFEKTGAHSRVRLVKVALEQLRDQL